MAKPNPQSLSVQQQTTNPQTPQATEALTIPFWDDEDVANLMYVEYVPHAYDSAKYNLSIGGAAAEFSGSGVANIQQDNPYDKLIINGITLPGVVVKGELEVKTETRVNVNQHAGKNKTSTLSLSRLPAQITATIKIWTKTQLAGTVAALSTLYPGPGQIAPGNTNYYNKDGTPKLPAFIISHPSLQFTQIRLVNVIGIEALKMSDSTEIKQYTIKMLEQMNDDKPNQGRVGGRQPGGPAPTSQPGQSGATTPPGQTATQTAAAQTVGQADPNNSSPADPNEQFSRNP